MFIDKLVYHKKNIKLFLDAHGMKILVDLLALAHLHTTRAYVPTQVSFKNNIICVFIILFINRLM